MPNTRKLNATVTLLLLMKTKGVIFLFVLCVNSKINQELTPILHRRVTKLNWGATIINIGHFPTMENPQKITIPTSHVLHSSETKLVRIFFFSVNSSLFPSLIDCTNNHNTNVSEFHPDTFSLSARNNRGSHYHRSVEMCGFMFLTQNLAF